MIKLNNLMDNSNLKVIDQKGSYVVLEHQTDMSVSPDSALTVYFMNQMNIRKRQVLVQLNGSKVITQAGAMQWTAGSVQMESGLKGGGIGGLFSKALKSAVTNESLSKPEYVGNGYLMLEPTYKFILLEDLASWNGGMVIDDGLFLACDGSVQQNVVSRSNLSSAVLGGEGLFNTSLNGYGIAVLESPVPREELIEIVLENDEVRIDGNMAIAWSPSLQFTVEKSTKSLIGSAISGEGFVNVYRGSGKILMTPTIDDIGIDTDGDGDSDD